MSSRGRASAARAWRSCTPGGTEGVLTEIVEPAAGLEGH